MVGQAQKKWSEILLPLRGIRMTTCRQCLQL
jgi:hypothetical protein